MHSNDRLYVYAIQIKDTNHFKIGIAKNPDKRLRQLQTGSSRDLVIAAYWDGDAGLEQAIHRELSAQYLRGEWFECEFAVIRATVERICQMRQVQASERAAKWKKGKPLLRFEQLPPSLFRAKKAIEQGDYLKAWQLIDAAEDLLIKECEIDETHTCVP